MRFRGATDEITKIDLRSSIERVAWTKKMASPNSPVGLEILTRHVGSNAEISIELSDHEGNKYGNFKEKISGNSFWAQIKVPQDAKQALYATAKLPKHGLQMKSNPLTLLPAVEITNLKWDKKEARRGDILKLTADVKGAQDVAEGEVSIWEYDDDMAHDFISKFPVTVKNGKIEIEWEFEYYEDTDDIPTEEETEKGYNPPEYFFRVKVGEVFADSELLEFKDWIRIEVRNILGEPVPNLQYTLYMPDGTQRKGSTDKNGYVFERDIPPGTCRVEFADLYK